MDGEEVAQRRARELEAARKLIEIVIGWYSAHFCPFCLQLDGTHTDTCPYAAYLKAREK